MGRWAGGASPPLNTTSTKDILVCIIRDLPASIIIIVIIIREQQQQQQRHY